MRLIHSVRWIALAQGARIGAQLLSVAMLTKFVEPADYGLMAMAMTVTNLAFLFRDIGATPAIIRRPRLSSSLKSTVFWANVLLGLLVALALLGAAIPVAHFYGQARLAGVIAALALVFPLSSVAILHQALLEREARFAHLAKAEIAGAGAGLLLALALALAGAGIWSLVAQMLAAALVNSALLLRWCRFRPARLFSQRQLASLIDASASFSLFRLVTYFERNVDSLIIGKLLGAALLGVYSLAIKIMLLPVQNLATVLGRALYPALCRERASGPAMGQLYLRALGAVSLATAPAMAGVFYLRAPLVDLLFGPAWAVVAQLLTWLAPVGFIQAITSSTGVVFLAVNDTRLLLRLGVFGSALMVASFALGPRWGIEGVAQCYLVANAINLLPCFVLSLRKLGIGLGAGLASIGMPVLAALAMLAVLAVLGPPLARLAGAPALALAAQIALGAASYVLVVLLVLRTDGADWKTLVSLR